MNWSSTEYMPHRISFYSRLSLKAENITQSTRYPLFAKYSVDAY